MSGPSPPKLLSPRPGSQPRRQDIPRRQDPPNREFLPNWKSPDPTSGLRNPPGMVPTDPAGLPLAIPEICGYTSTQKGRVSPNWRGAVTPPSDLPETSASPTRVSAAVTGMFQYTQLTVQLYVHAGLFRTLIGSATSDRSQFSLVYTKLCRSCASPDYTKLRSYFLHHYSA